MLCKRILNCVSIVNIKTHVIGAGAIEVETSIPVSAVNSELFESVKLVTNPTRIWFSFHCLICAAIVVREGLRSRARKRKLT